MKFKNVNLLASFLAFALTVCVLWGLSIMNCGVVNVMSDVEVPEETGQMSGLEFVQNLKIGWNLGNTFDAPGGETAWGNPVVTADLFAYLKELGFQTVRIPISWRMHVSPAPAYQIQESFMNRVDEVVNYALDAGLNVIINSHHDNEIYYPAPDNSEKGQAYLTAIWSQIAEHFKDYDNRLIFQTMNEPRVVGKSYEWALDSGKTESVEAVKTVNGLNQAALDAIRATGGNNLDRFVIISPYAGNMGAAISSFFVLPEDVVADRLIVSIHAYTPYSLCLDLRSKASSFGKGQQSEINSMLKSINYVFVKKGIPVIIDEMGCLNKNNPDARYAWGKGYISAAQKYGIPCLWWDNGAIGGTGENFGLVDRRQLNVFEESLTAYQGLMDGLKQ